MKHLKKILFSLLLLSCFIQADIAITNNIKFFSFREGFGQYDTSDGGHKITRSPNNPNILHVVFIHRDSDNDYDTNYNLVYARSGDNGNHWTTEVLDTIHSVGNNYICDPAIAVFNNEIYISYVSSTAEGFSLDADGLRVIKFTDQAVGSRYANWVYNSSGSYSVYTDIAIDKNGYIYIATGDDNDQRKIRLFRSDLPGSTTFIEENPNNNPGHTYFVPGSMEWGQIPHLIVDQNGNVYLAIDIVNIDPDINTDAIRIAIFKRNAAGVWSNPININQTYTGYISQHAKLAYDNNKNELHIVYSEQAVPVGQMTLRHRVYNSALNEITGSGFPVITADQIFSPQIGFTTANIPVIQYVESNNNGASYQVKQISQRAPTIWTTGALIKSVSSSGKPVFLHMLPEILNDRPQMLWYDLGINTVYFNQPNDYIAPWQPSAPTMQWQDKGYNSENSQGVTVSIAQDWNALTAQPTANAILYHFAGENGAPADNWTSFAVNKSFSGLGDRQTVTVQVQARDHSGNTSVLSNPIKVVIGDRTKPNGSININNNAVYANSTAIALHLAYNDAKNSSLNQSGMRTTANFTGITTPVQALANNISVMLNGNTNGLRTVTVDYKDIAGNNSLFSDAIYLDTVSPHITSTPIVLNSSSATPGQRSWAATDNLSNGYASGVSTYNVYWGMDNAGTAISSVQAGASHTPPAPLTSQGAYYLRVQPIDKAGNIGDWATVLTYIYDNTGPGNASVTINNGDIYANTINVQLSLHADDAVSMNISNTSGEASGSWYDYSASKPWTLTAGDGNKTVFVWYKDAASNLSPAIDTIILDTTPPSGGNGTDGKNNSFYGVVINDNDEWTNSLFVTLNIKAIDNNSVVSMNISNTPNVLGSWYPYNEIFTNWRLADNGAITKTVYVIFRDTAGNTSNAVSDNIKFSNAKPAAGSIIINNNAEWTKSLFVTLNLTASGIASVTSMNIRNSDGNWTGWQPFVSVTKNWQLAPGNSPAQKIVEAMFMDAAGNTSNIYSDEINYDETPPAGEIIEGTGKYGVVINNDAEWTRTLSVTLSIKATDNIGIVSMNISNTNNFDQANWEIYQTTKNNWPLFADSNIIKTVFVIFSDAAGNISSPVTDNIKYNNLPPTGDIVTGTSKYGIAINNDAEWTTSLNVTLNIRAASSVGIVTSMNISNQPDLSGGTGWIPYGTVTTNWPMLNNGDINKYVYIRFMNEAGNISDIYSDDIKYGNAPPTGGIIEGTGKAGIVINNNAEWTTSLNVTLNISATSNPSPVTEMNISDQPNLSGGTGWIPYATITTNWQLLSDAEVTKTVYIQFRNAAGVTSAVFSDDIKFDEQKPTGDTGTDGEGHSFYGVVINDGAELTATYNVRLSLQATDNIGVKEMKLSNAANFANSTGWIPYATNYPSWILSGNMTVYATFRDAAGNESAPVSDDIKLDKPDFISFFFTEPDGTDDIASDNFTISWEDNYGGDPQAKIELRIVSTQNASGSNINDLISENILVSDGVNGLIWDSSAYSSGVYYPVAIISGNAGAWAVTSNYPIYVIHDNWPIPFPPEHPLPPGPLPQNPPSILVIEPDGVKDQIYDNKFEITWDTAFTLGDDSMVSIYYDTDRDKNNGFAGLLTANIPAESDPRKYEWLLDNIPEGKYYIYAAISNNYYLCDDYSTGYIESKPNITVGNGGTGEEIYSYPNPLKPADGDEAKIGFWVKKDGWYTVYVYNVRGERVWQGDAYGYAGKENLLIWNGRTPRDQPASNGIYILLLTNEQKKITARGRMTVLD